MSGGVNAEHALELIRSQLLVLVDILRSGAAKPRNAKIPYSILLPGFEVNQTPFPGTSC